VVPPGADLFGQLGLDQLLEHDADGLADQIDSLGAVQRVG
jgi:hypothetical protein